MIDKSGNQAALAAARKLAERALRHNDGWAAAGPCKPVVAPPGIDGYGGLTLHPRRTG
jgi:hypothetical protein